MQLVNGNHGLGSLSLSLELNKVRRMASVIVLFELSFNQISLLLQADQLVCKKEGSAKKSPF